MVRLGICSVIIALEKRVSQQETKENNSKNYLKEKQNQTST